MDLKKQYQTEMQHIAPSEEQCEKIRARVYEEIQKPQEAPKRKKPLPLKAIAITGASAACLVLAATFALQFTLGKKLDNAAGGMAIQGRYNKTADVAGSVSEAINCQDGLSGGSAYSANCGVAAPTKSLPAESVLSEGDAVLRIEFSEDLSECVVYSGGEVKQYALSDEAEPAADDAKLLTEIPEDRSNLGEELFVRIENSKIRVYDRNKEFLGAFVEIT